MPELHTKMPYKFNFRPDFERLGIKYPLDTTKRDLNGLFLRVKNGSNVGFLN